MRVTQNLSHKQQYSSGSHGLNARNGCDTLQNPSAPIPGVFSGISTRKWVYDGY
jgi:hypothetical protein